MSQYPFPVEYGHWPPFNPNAISSFTLNPAAMPFVPRSIDDNQHIPNFYYPRHPANGDPSSHASYPPANYQNMPVYHPEVAGLTPAQMAQLQNEQLFQQQFRNNAFLHWLNEQYQREAVDRSDTGGNYELFRSPSIFSRQPTAPVSSRGVTKDIFEKVANELWKEQMSLQQSQAASSRDVQVETRRKLIAQLRALGITVDGMEADGREKKWKRPLLFRQNLQFGVECYKCRSLVSLGWYQDDTDRLQCHLCVETDGPDGTVIRLPKITPEQEATMKGRWGDSKGNWREWLNDGTVGCRRMEFGQLPSIFRNRPESCYEVGERYTLLGNRTCILTHSFEFRPLQPKEGVAVVSGQSSEPGLKRPSGTENDGGAVEVEVNTDGNGPPDHFSISDDSDFSVIENEEKSSEEDQKTHPEAVETAVLDASDDDIGEEAWLAVSSAVLSNDGLPKVNALPTRNEKVSDVELVESKEEEEEEDSEEEEISDEEESEEDTSEEETSEEEESEEEESEEETSDCTTEGSDSDATSEEELRLSDRDWEKEYDSDDDSDWLPKNASSEDEGTDKEGEKRTEVRESVRVVRQEFTDPRGVRVQKRSRVQKRVRVEKHLRVDHVDWPMVIALIVIFYVMVTVVPFTMIVHKLNRLSSLK